MTRPSREQATRINASEALQGAGNLLLTWNPVTEALAIHRARILRGGRTIDLLANGRRFTVLRRESNLEAAMIDGELTATLQPEGLQVGDVLDLAYTLTRREPALAGHSEGGAYTAHAGTVGRLVVRGQLALGAHIPHLEDRRPAGRHAGDAGRLDRGGLRPDRRRQPRPA